MVHPTPTTRTLSGEAGGRVGRAAGETGYVIPMVGLLLIPLMVVTAFAIDIGTFYAKGTDLQRAVDMAAMAGVVWLPNTAKAQTEASAVLARNGYTSTNATISYSVPTDTRYRVSATVNAPRFFSGVITSSNQGITRASTAEYNKPVPMGSPLGSFGNTLSGDLNGDGDGGDANECIDPQAAANTANCKTGSGSQPQVWAAINGPFTSNADGDPYATLCLTGTSCTSITNGEYRGYYTYAIEVFQAGQTVTVQIYDAPSYSSSIANNFTEDSANFKTAYEIFNEDGSDLTASTTPALSMKALSMCSTGPGQRTFPSAYQSSTYHNRWWTLCTFTAPQPGIYPLVVRSTNLPADSSTGATACATTNCPGSGWNAYALRATASGTTPRIYGLGDMSIWNVANASTATFYLAEVEEIHAGKKFVLDMYDPGDGGGNDYTMTIKGPGGTAFPCTLKYGATTGLRGDTSGGTEPYGTACSFKTRQSGNNRFNDRWVRIEIQIPTNYTCPTVSGNKDCWWKVDYQFGGDPTDRTVWAVQIVGDPVHLTE